MKFTTNQRPDNVGRPSSIDAHVGSRIRARRTFLGMSQGRLGNGLGLTFQQIQKYEGGVNGVGASRLFDFARVLYVPISFFFDDMPRGIGATPMSGPRGRAHSFLAAQVALPPGDVILAKRETLELVRAYYGISDPAVRKRVLHLMRGLGSAEVSKTA